METLKLFLTKREAIEFATSQDGAKSFVIVYHGDEEKPWQIIFRDQFRGMSPTAGDRGDVGESR